jgi:hypothetical protein
VPFAVYLDLLPALAPRYYSISSSPLLNPQACSITDGVLHAPARCGVGDFDGVCSTYLQSMEPGSTVFVFTRQPTIPFRPPAGFDLSRVHPDSITRDAGGEVVAVQGIVICTRLVGETFSSGMKDLAVNIAYVIDNTLTRDPAVDFGKLEFAAIGFIDDSPTDVLLPGETAPA